MSNHAELDELVRQWLAVDRNESTRQEIIQCHKDKKYDVLEKKLGTRIAFGTAGLRSSMEAGFAHMNDVTVVQASQGLVEYIISQPENTHPSLVVGYDHRHHSQRFAELTASVALAAGLTVYYLGTAENLSTELSSTSDNTKDRLYVHTPMVPFGIDHFHASGGVMVTASHNPAKDNGYKVYYSNGCQIIPPHDHGIAASISTNLQPKSSSWEVESNFEKGLASGKLRIVKEGLTKAYVDAVKESLIADSSISYKFVYTPMHGVGHEIFAAIYKQFKGPGFEVAIQQLNPDPDFPTVKFPNPEEAGALDMAIALAKKSGMKLVVANDPDADRFSVAVDVDGEWEQLTGNEIGILFAVYVIEELVPKKDLSQTYLLNSTVSSQLLKSLASKTGCHFQDTLTGFKWIGNRAIDLKNEGKHVPFAYEEAIGYMFSIVNDKDGISAAVMWLQLYEKWFSAGVSVKDKLHDIYSKYGFFKECNGYYKLDDLKKTDKIFNQTIRKSYDNHEKYPRRIGTFSVSEWRDLTIGFDSSTADNIPNLPTDKSSQMITAILKDTGSGAIEGAVRFTCRGSGTEPKLKVYIEGTSSSEKSAQALADKCWAVLRDEWFRPQENGLEEVV